MSVRLPTLDDMGNAVDKGMVMSDIRVMEEQGASQAAGRSSSLPLRRQRLHALGLGGRIRCTAATDLRFSGSRYSKPVSGASRI